MFSKWQIVFALVQLETVIAIGGVLAHLAGTLQAGTLATLLVGLLGTSRIPAAVRFLRSKRDDDDEPPGGATATTTQPPVRKHQGEATVLVTSGILTLLVGLAEWKALLRGAT